MLEKNQSDKKVNEVSDFINPICQDTFQSLPKIYGTIKNKVITNKINFYQNIKRKQRVNLMKSFNKNDIIEQSVKFVSPKSKQKLHNRSIIQKKSQIKEEIDPKKIARFEDKYHKLDIKSNQRHSRIVTSNTADDNESKHKIKFNTIKFLPMIHYLQNQGQDSNRKHSDSVKENVSKSLAINNPLVNLYKQNKRKIKKINTSISEEGLIDYNRPDSNFNRYYTSKGKKDVNIKERMKTQHDSSASDQIQIRKPSFKTQFSRRIQDQKTANMHLGPNQNKFHIPTAQQYKNFIQSYHPINPAFNLKKLIKENHFQIISYQDGVYFGISELGVRGGEGVLVTQNSIFQGVFQDDSKMKGTEQNIDGKYVGYFKKDLREGKGRYEWLNGEVFEGEWKSGKKNGYGVWQSPNGDSYVGNWLNGRQHGQGTHTHKSSVYKGQFANSLKHGYGEQSFANGDKFKGSYVRGKPQGKGRYEWVDGSYYEGQFKGGYRDGQGVLRQVDGSTYKGSFRRDFKHGFGKQMLKSGQTYEVQYKEGIEFSKTPANV